MLDERNLRRFERELRLLRDGSSSEEASGEADQASRSSRVTHIARAASKTNPAVQNQLRRIDAALARIDAGRFGLCCQCHEPLDAAWLAADPATPFCQICAEEIAEKRRRVGR